ncbi:hypothetical protein AD934_04380 [Gluconobacter oxydans]|uniref:Uncharacterized protein n=1 Tax=Gluconobacter oxydans TaxID=442 RepID=A0A149RYA8_GLUOY|nr:hypothetical protein AD934_04380 [Gluconobacter oxydans]
MMREIIRRMACIGVNRRTSRQTDISVATIQTMAEQNAPILLCHRKKTLKRAPFHQCQIILDPENTHPVEFPAITLPNICDSSPAKTSPRFVRHIIKTMGPDISSPSDRLKQSPGSIG